jgi:hypothetical protein
MGHSLPTIGSTSALGPAIAHDAHGKWFAKRVSDGTRVSTLVAKTPYAIAPEIVSDALVG